MNSTAVIAGSVAGAIFAGVFIWAGRIFWQAVFPGRNIQIDPALFSLPSSASSPSSTPPVQPSDTSQASTPLPNLPLN